MSGIYILGMKCPKPKLADMATVYYAYILVSPNGHAAIVVDNEDGLDSTEYPLIPVPDHGRLIDADALIDKVVAKYLKFERKGKLVFAAAEIKQDICDLISDAPAIIPASEEGET